MNFETFCSKLESELMKYNFVKEDCVYDTNFILGDFVLYKIEHRFDKYDIWYRNTLHGYFNRVMFDEKHETTQKEWDKVTDSISNVLKEYKKYLVKTKIDELENDFS